MMAKSTNELWASLQRAAARDIVFDAFEEVARKTLTMIGVKDVKVGSEIIQSWQKDEDKDVAVVVDRLVRLICGG